MNLPWEIALHAVTPPKTSSDHAPLRWNTAGRRSFLSSATPAQRELDEFVNILKGEGVIVRRPDCLESRAAALTPEWTSPAGNSQANPRDVLIVIGNEILEAPMSWRSRYFEFFAYRNLVMEYWRQGAKWTAAPKPMMSHRLYD